MHINIFVHLETQALDFCVARLYQTSQFFTLIMFWSSLVHKQKTWKKLGKTWAQLKREFVEQAPTSISSLFKKTGHTMNVAR